MHMELKMILDKNTFNVFGGGWSYLPEELFSVCLEANLETKQITTIYFIFYPAKKQSGLKKKKHLECMLLI